MKNLIKQARELAKPFCVTGDRFRLKDVDPGDTLQFASADKPREKEALAMGVTLMAELQDRLYAQDRRRSMRWTPLISNIRKPTTAS